MTIDEAWILSAVIAWGILSQVRFHTHFCDQLLHSSSQHAHDCLQIRYLWLQILLHLPDDAERDGCLRNHHLLHTDANTKAIFFCQSQCAKRCDKAPTSLAAIQLVVAASPSSIRPVVALKLS